MRASLRSAVALALITLAFVAGCSSDDPRRATSTTTMLDDASPTDADHVAPPCDFGAGDRVEAADFRSECISLYDCPDGRVLAVAGLPPGGPEGDLAGFLADRGDPRTADTMWRPFEEKLPTKPNYDTGRNELVGACPSLS